MEQETSSTQRGSGHPAQLVATLRAAAAALESVARPSRSSGTLSEWAEAVAVSQRLVNAAVAAQNEAIVALAAIETDELDDGTVVEHHRAPGHLAMDAPAIVSGALVVSEVHAEHRVHDAVRLAADGPTGTTTETGLGELHDAMRRGDLDAYRAGVVAEELEMAPPEVAAAVVAAISGFLAVEAGPQLRRRCRRVLARISPDLLRQRAKRARESCGLRRWAEEPGVDRWEGTFPSEDAVRAWAAIDALAQRLMVEGTCERVDRARGQALIDLVTGSATIETVLTLTVPAETGISSTRDSEAGDSGTHDRGTGSSQTGDRRTGTSQTGDRRTGTSQTGDRRTGTSQTGTSRTGTGEPPTAGQRGTVEDVATTARDSAAAPDGGDLVEVSTGRSVQPLLVLRSFLERVSAEATTVLEVQGCDVDSGALLDDTTSASYRPSGRVAALVKRRDGRCRFPGCHVAARFCDLDHVRPWPAGPTAAANLMCLCRRHHRIKQRRGWRVRIHPDAVVTWTDPTGRVRTTSPIDALRTVVLPAPAVEHGSPRAELTPGDAPTPSDAPTRSDALTHDDAWTQRHASRCRAGPWSTGVGTDVHSSVEFALEHGLAGRRRFDGLHAGEMRHGRRAARSGGGDTRLHGDLHDSRDRVDWRARLTFASDWPGAPRHPTRWSGRRDHTTLDDDPPF